MIKISRCFCVALLTTFSIFAISVSAAETYPTRPIRLVIPYAPGGATDITARTLAPVLYESMGQQVVVDNRSGGASIPGTDMVAKAAPDGYTLLITSSSHGVLPSLFSKLPFNAQKDFTSVSLIAVLPFVLAVHPSLPARSVGELITLTKAKPGSLNYASSGNGSATHMAMELFKYIAKINIVQVPYKGGGPAVVAIVSGETSIMFTIVSTALQHFRGGRLIPLGVSTSKRISVLPDVPTITEAGVPDYVNYEWQGIFAPAGTPKRLVDRLHEEIIKALANPGVRERIIGSGADVVGSTPQELDAHIKAEIAKWSAVAKANGIKAD